MTAIAIIGSNMLHSLKSFDAARVAALETRMWKAYYAHEFFHLAILLVRLFKEQFHVNTLVALRLGYHSGKAAAVFKKSGDQQQTLSQLTKYYGLLNAHAQEKFDPSTAAKLELEWWLIHRHPKKYEMTLQDSLACSIAILYCTDGDQVRRYAEERAEAMRLRDRATHIDKVAPDWQKIQKHLLASYSELHKAVNQ